MKEEKEKFSTSDLIEVRDKLEALRIKMNSLVENMDVSIFEDHHISKERTRIKNIYYAGGTLCMDFNTRDFSGQNIDSMVMMNISSETCTWVHNGIEKPQQLMSLQLLWFAFMIYGTVKGFHRQYYRECYLKSCIRHLYNFHMEKRKANDISDDIIIGIYDMAEKSVDFALDILHKYGIETGKVKV